MYLEWPISQVETMCTGDVDDEMNTEAVIKVPPVGAVGTTPRTTASTARVTIAAPPDKPTQDAKSPSGASGRKASFRRHTPDFAKTCGRWRPAGLSRLLARGGLVQNGNHKHGFVFLETG